MTEISVWLILGCYSEEHCWITSPGKYVKIDEYITIYNVLCVEVCALTQHFSSQLDSVWKVIVVCRQELT